MRARLARLWLFLPVLGLLSGCGDPYQRPGTWRIVGVNQANLNTMVVNPIDTVAGHQEPGSDAILDAAAAGRLHADQAKKLTNESTTTGGS